MAIPYPISELWAWVVDDPTGVHGIMAVRRPDGMPMQAVASKRSTMEILRPFAERAAEHTGLPVELRRYVLAEVAEKIG